MSRVGQIDDFLIHIPCELVEHLLVWTFVPQGIRRLAVPVNLVSLSLRVILLVWVEHNRTFVGVKLSQFAVFIIHAPITFPFARELHGYFLVLMTRCEHHAEAQRGEDAQESIFPFHI